MLARIEEKLAEGIIGRLVKKILKWPVYAQLLLFLGIMLVGYILREPDTIRRLPQTCSRAYRAVVGRNQLPLTQRQRADLQKAIQRIINGHIKPGVESATQNRKPSANRYEAWPVAQMTLALFGETAQDGTALFPKDDYAPLVDRVLDTTGGWKEYHARVEHPVHIGSSGWVVFVKGRLEIAASNAEINFLVQSTNKSGGWPMFPSEGDDSHYGSTYATAWAGLALHEQAHRAWLQPEQAKQCRAAVATAARWLQYNAKHLNGLWKFYYNYPQQNEISWSNSGLVIHFFHHLNRGTLRQEPIDIRYYDQAWLAKLPIEPPLADSFESWNLDVPIKGKKSFRENVRCLKLPWVIIATADAYPNGTLRQRMKALEFTDNLLYRLPTIENECSQQSWMLAELAIALRHLDSGYLLPPR